MPFDNEIRFRPHRISLENSIAKDISQEATRIKAFKSIKINRKALTVVATDDAQVPEGIMGTIVWLLTALLFFYQNSRKPFESIFLSWWGAKSKKTSDEKETQYFAQGHIRLRENPHHYEFHFLLLFNLQHSPLSWARNLKMLAVWKCQNLKTRLFFWHYATLVLGCYHNGTARKGVIMINLILRDCRAVFGCNLEGFLRAFTFDESNSKTLFLCVVAVQSRLLMENVMDYLGFYLLLFFYVWRLRLF